MKQYTGADISQANFDAYIQVTEKTLYLGCFNNDPEGYENYGEAVRNNQVTDNAIHLVVEPTGGYEMGLVLFAFEQGWQVSRPNPKQVRDWARGQGVRGKTDKIDANVLTCFGMSKNPPAETLMPAFIRTLAALLARREDLEKLRRAECNRLHILHAQPDTTTQAIASVERTLTFLESELSHIAQDIQQILAEQPQLKKQRKLLLSVPGVGDKTVLPILVLLHRWDALTHGKGSAKALTAYTGLDPVPFSSGTSIYKHPGISKMGNRSLRSKLFMAALGGTRAKSTPLTDFYRRLVGRGKAKKLALVASSRKILVWSLAVFRKNEMFDSSRFQKTPV